MTILIGIVFLLGGWALMRYLIHKKRANGMFDFSKLIWASLFYTKKSALLSFITLASGVFIVFAVGLNRRSFADSSQMRTATGGFSLWCETIVPVYHNINTPEGRAKLALKDLPIETQVMQLLKYNADDASCLNLNKVETPNVLGVDMDQLERYEFRINWGTDAINRVCTDFPPAPPIYPALVDETVLTWSLGKKLGDTIEYMGENGEAVTLQLAGTIQNSIFQGYLLIDKAIFSQIWSQISGSEVMLFKVPDDEVARTQALISQALNNYGVRVMTTGERMKMFYSVTDAYLTIFLTLGGLGLLLGIFSFVIVVRKNLVARMKETSCYGSLGFDQKHMEKLLYQENILIPLCALATGAAGAFLGVGIDFGHVGVRIVGLVLLFLILFVFCVALFVKHSVKSYLSNNYL